MAGAYLFTGLAKLMSSGLAWLASDNLRFALYASSDTQPDPNALALFVADRPWLAHLGAAGVRALEFAFPVVLWRPWWGWAFVLAAATLTHAGRSPTLWV